MSMALVLREENNPAPYTAPTTAEVRDDAHGRHIAAKVASFLAVNGLWAYLAVTPLADTPTRAIWAVQALVVALVVAAVLIAINTVVRLSDEYRPTATRATARQVVKGLAGAVALWVAGSVTLGPVSIGTLRYAAVVLAAGTVGFAIGGPLLRAFVAAVNAARRPAARLIAPLGAFAGFCWYPVRRAFPTGITFGRGQTDPVPVEFPDGHVEDLAPKRNLPTRLVPSDGTPVPYGRFQRACRFDVPVVRPYSSDNIARRVGIGPVTVLDLTPVVFNVITVVLLIL